MIKLPLSLRAWNTNDFHSVIRNEVTSIDATLLPLQEGLRYSSIANASSLSVSLLNSKETDKELLIKVGLFYTGIIAGCNCADDPTPVDENNEYCEALLSINKSSAETTIILSD